VCPRGSPLWIIKTNPYNHTCIQEITRSYHAQSTVKMIAGAIKKELEEDMTLTIKTICALLIAKFSGVNPSYSKIWRGRIIRINFWKLGVFVWYTTLIIQCHSINKS
jgi:hypothetical protein